MNSLRYVHTRKLSHMCTCVLVPHRLAKPKTVLKYATWALNKDQAMAVKVSEVS